MEQRYDTKRVLRGCDGTWRIWMRRGLSAYLSVSLEVRVRLVSRLETSLSLVLSASAAVHPSTTLIGPKNVLQRDCVTDK